MEKSECVYEVWEAGQVVEVKRGWESLYIDLLRPSKRQHECCGAPKQLCPMCATRCNSWIRGLKEVRRNAKALLSRLPLNREIFLLLRNSELPHHCPASPALFATLFALTVTR